MPAPDQSRPFNSEMVAKLLELSEVSADARSLDDFAARALRLLAEIAHSPGVFLYVKDPLFPSPFTSQYGLPPDAAGALESKCTRELPPPSGASRENPSRMCFPLTLGADVELILHLLSMDKGCCILLGTMPESNEPLCEDDVRRRALGIAGRTITRILEGIRLQRHLDRLNTYISLRSMLMQSLDLHELLEAILYCSVAATSAEEASVMVLDDDRANFHFYQIEGPSKPLLTGVTFPADRGIAGSVLASQEAEIINDVPSDPRFYGNIDAKSGFRTRNMVAAPLTAGEEKIGVIEVVNKMEGGLFTEEDRLFLIMIAEEIGFAIRNAKLFEIVVNSYCKQRQGQNSCKGCKRPLGSWTPCVKYRQEG